MRVCVNGETMDLPDGLSLADLMDRLGLHPRRVAVERNRRLVTRATFPDTALAADDAIEIVTLVGGG